ncbi:MAG TPA: tRNA uracil 4-sulfurtransferase ThiI [Blastocatellia bacterium]|nr:tRNA uracil 4-sulfurtransferase ThiI [Blastocatellia bacterium]
MTSVIMVERLVLVRYDEIGIKGRNRPDFTRKLAENIRRVTGVERGRVRIEWGRLYILAGEDEAELLRALPRVFGIRSVSPAVRLPFDTTLLEQEAVTLARREYERGARTFKIETRRSLKTFPLTSLDVNRLLGTAIQRAIPDFAVDVHHPDTTIGVEIRQEGILLFAEWIEGPGGLPVGINGRALVLLSGGIDSPVAAWMAMKRGIAVDVVYFHSFPYTGDKAKEKVIELSRCLSRWKGEPVTVYIPSFTDLQVEISRQIPPPLWTIFHRRFMYRVAERLATEHGYGALVTGESLGQVASQTLENLSCVDAAVNILVLRPLIGLDKAEIVTLARRIGTYDISILPYEDCCTLFAPKKPVTRARRDRVEQLEQRLDVERLIAAALSRTEVFSVTETMTEQVVR